MTPSRLPRALRVGAAAAGVALGAALLAAAPADAAPAHPAPACALGSSTVSASVSPDTGLSDRFTAYGNSGRGWTGADSTYSLPLGPGTEGWFFSDTFLGSVNPDGSRPTDAPFVHNSIVVDSRGTLRTVVGGTPDSPDSLISTGVADTWYWIGDPERAASGIQVPLLQFARTGDGAFDFAWQRNRVATLDPRTLTPRRIDDIPSATGIEWASWTQRSGASTLVYGVKDVPTGGATVRSSFVARVTGDGLRGRWTFWTGSRWSPREADAAAIATGVSNEYSVAPFRDGWLMVTQDSTEPLSPRIVAQVSCSPTGPFHAAGTIYTTPETGATGSYADPDVYTYNAHEHPELRSGDRLLVTYNVNTFDNKVDVFRDASIYRPRFLDVHLAVTPGR